MAIRFDASGDSLSRITGLPSITAFTIMGWVRMPTITDHIQTLFSFGDSTGGEYYGATARTTAEWSLWNGSSDSSFAGTVAANTWYHVAMVCDGTSTDNLRLYIDGALMVQHSGNSNVAAQKLWAANNNDTEWTDGRYAAVKVFGAALTLAEIQQERWSYLPVRTANLNGWYPLLQAGDLGDNSGSGNSWTVGGTLATEDGPPIVWRRGQSRIFVPALVLGSPITGFQPSAFQNDAFQVGWIPTGTPPTFNPAWARNANVMIQVPQQ